MEDPGEYQKLPVKRYPALALRETPEGKFWRRFQNPKITTQVSSVARGQRLLTLLLVNRCFGEGRITLERPPGVLNGAIRLNGFRPLPLLPFLLLRRERSATSTSGRIAPTIMSSLQEHG